MTANDLAGAVPVLLALAVVGASVEAHASEDTGLRSDLQSVARWSVFFGHQSVGANVLDGVARLSTRGGVPLLVKDVSSAPAAPPATLAHAFVAENGDPQKKLGEFARYLGAISGRSPELAMVKFCYVDFAADTDVTRLFDRYQATLAELRRTHPATTFVHVTVPLTTVQGGAKGFLKRVTGRAPHGLLENARREQYNDLLRKAYGGREPIFDLSVVESTRPDGGRETMEWQGRKVPVLVAEYASDDGHLNEAGQDRAARALLAVLAAARP